MAVDREEPVNETRLIPLTAYLETARARVGKPLGAAFLAYELPRHLQTAASWSEAKPPLTVELDLLPLQEYLIALENSLGKPPTVQAVDHYLTEDLRHLACEHTFKMVFREGRISYIPGINKIASPRHPRIYLFPNDLLVFGRLMLKTGVAVGMSELIELLGPDLTGVDRLVHRAVYRVRKKLGDKQECPSDFFEFRDWEYIHNVIGVGYRLKYLPKTEPEETAEDIQLPLAS